MQAELFGSDGFIENEPTCPSNGLYIFGLNVVPATGAIYMTCSLSASRDHVPQEYESW